ncbi:MAG TPA: hypothetical protein VN690_08005 [Terriglobales bacterium]|nr:hypothetical protein [Terriglobales bacterium]
MDWESEPLYNKSKVFARRAHEQSVNSSLFAFWMSLSLEALARATLSSVHPALLADPKEPDNIYYAFGVTPKGIPRSIPSKALYARCAVFITEFTPGMVTHCLDVANRRNSELHSGAAAFEGISNSAWLPMTYEVMDVLIKKLGRNFDDFLGEYSPAAIETLKDRHDSLAKDVAKRLADAKERYLSFGGDERSKINEKAKADIPNLLKKSVHSKQSKCPACENDAVISGKPIGRSPVVLDKSETAILREIRVLPNRLQCPYCKLVLLNFQEVRQAGLGDIFTSVEAEDPISFFGIEPEDYVDVGDFMRRHAAGLFDEYDNE